MECIERIVENIEKIQKARGMSRAELARKAETSPQQVYQQLSSKRMNLDSLCKYANALGVSVGTLTDGIVNPEEFELSEDLGGRWPYNLAIAVLGTDKDIYQVYAPGLIDSLDELLEREKDILIMRYKHYATLETCGNKYNVQRERIRQIEARALRKLRHPRIRRNWMMDTMHKAWEIAKERDNLALEVIRLKSRIPDEELTTAEKEDLKSFEWNIEDLELSVRSYNCLCRANLKKESDFDGITLEKLMKVRNLGRKSMDEIIVKLKERGINVR